jgi:hypothetical protein
MRNVFTLVNMLTQILGLRKISVPCPPAPLFRVWLKILCLRLSLRPTIGLVRLPRPLLMWGILFCFPLGSMEVVDSTLVLHLLAQRLAAIYVPTPDNIHPRSCLSAGVVACIYARWFSSPYRLDIGLPCFTWCFRRMIFVFSSDSVLGVVVSHRYWPPLASFPYPSGSAFLFEVCLPVGL